MDLVRPLAAGAVTGAILSAFAGIYGKHMANDMLGWNASHTVRDILRFFTMGSMFLLAAFAVVLRDIGFIVVKPWHFLAELATLALCTLAISNVLHWSRGEVLYRTAPIVLVEYVLLQLSSALPRLSG